MPAADGPRAAGPGPRGRGVAGALARALPLRPAAAGDRLPGLRRRQLPHLHRLAPGQPPDRRLPRRPGAAREADPVRHAVPERLLAAGADRGAAASRSTIPSRAFDGLTLYTSGHAQKAFLVSMDGEVVHEWQLPFSAGLGRQRRGPGPAARRSRLRREGACCCPTATCWRSTSPSAPRPGVWAWSS